MIGQGGWAITGASTVSPIQPVVGSLVFDAANTATGNRVFLTDGGQDVRLVFNGSVVATPADGNTYYYSSLLRHDGTDIGNTTGDYILHFLNGTVGGSSAFRGRLFIKDSGTVGSAAIGLRFSSADVVQFHATLVPANTTVAVVVKVTEVPGADNDNANLWVFVGGSIPTSEPGSGFITATADAGQDISALPAGGLGQMSIRQGSAAAAPKVDIDDLRAGTTWADVVPASAVSDWSMYN